MLIPKTGQKDGGNMLNKVMIIGNVGKEVEMRFTPSGKKITFENGKFY